MSTTLTSNLFICLLILIHNLRKILIILINDTSDSNLSSKFTVLVVVVFTKIELVSKIVSMIRISSLSIPIAELWYKYDQYFKL